MHVLNRIQVYVRKLQRLADSDYFNSELNNVVCLLVRICVLVIKNEDQLDEDELEDFQYAVSRICLHFEGSTKNNLPYAVDFCISRTIENWCSLEKFTILHAFTDDDQDFYFDPEPLETVQAIASMLNPELKLSEHLIFIGTPRVFMNIPLYCAILYHEVAHFVDLKLEISNSVFGIDEKSDASTLISIDHYMEFFADLFAASYIGEIAADVLNILIPNHSVSDTHPSTPRRIEFIKKFCKGEDFEVLNKFQSFLKANNLNSLELRFTPPDIVSCFDDGRPYDIQSEKELHGIWIAAWRYLKDIEDGRDPGWPSQFSDFDFVQIVNDLLEKSITNRIITENLEKPVKTEDLHGVKIAPLLDSGQIDGSSVDLRIGLNFQVPVQSLNPPIKNVSDKAGCNSLSQHFQQKRREMDETFMLRPNQAVLAVSLEDVAMPDDFYGEVHIHESFAERGISFRTEIGPGYRGCVPIELINRGNEPVEIIVGARMFNMAVSKVDGKATRVEADGKHFALVRPDLRRLSDYTTLEQLQEFV